MVLPKATPIPTVARKREKELRLHIATILAADIVQRMADLADVAENRGLTKEALLESLFK